MYQENPDHRLTLLKDIYRISPEKAVSMSNSILSNYKSNSPQIVSLANKTLIRTLDENNQSDLKKILDYNKQILSDPNVSNEYVQGSLFALSELNQEEAVQLVFENVDFNNQIGMHYFVENNFESLSSYLQNKDFSATERIVRAVSSSKFKPMLESVELMRSADSNSAQELLSIIEEANSVSNKSPRAYEVEGYEGYAAFRDGVFVVAGKSLNWHAGIVTGSGTGVTVNQLVHIAGTGYKVSTVNKTDFIRGPENKNNNPVGIFRKTTSLATRSNIIDDAINLTNEGISYTFFDLLSYEDGYLGSDITPDRIVSMRCDGVVEYCYEVNGQRLMGTDSTWNISKRSGAEYHNSCSITTMSPKAQSGTMTKVTSSF